MTAIFNIQKWFKIYAHILLLSSLGLGLGLSIAHALATMHGGKLIGSSEGANKGATFTLTLPVVIGKKNNAH